MYRRQNTGLSSRRSRVPPTSRGVGPAETPQTWGFSLPAILLLERLDSIVKIESPSRACLP